jgi:hypothetical protein
MNIQKLTAYLFLIVAVLASTAGQVQAGTKIAGATAELVTNSPQDDPRVEHLRSFLENYNSPAASDADHFIAEADRLSLDWKLVAAIAGVESTFCRFIPSQSHNCWGWGIPTGAQKGIGFVSYRQGITRVSEGLRYRYIDRDLVTIDQIGRVYAASPAWSTKVRFFMDRIDNWQPRLSASSVRINLWNQSQPVFVAIRS